MSDFNAKIYQIQFRLGLRAPQTLLGSLQRSPRPLAALRGPTSKGREGTRPHHFTPPPPRLSHISGYAPIFFVRLHVRFVRALNPAAGRIKARHTNCKFGEKKISRRCTHAVQVTTTIRHPFDGRSTAYQRSSGSLGP